MPKKNKRRDFYVYWLLRENGAPFWVGKGVGKRIEISARDGGTINSKKKAIIRRFKNKGLRVPREKLLEGLTEQEALFWEVLYIAGIGRCENGPLVNLTDGGEGTAGYVMPLGLVKKRAKTLRATLARPDVKKRKSTASKLVWSDPVMRGNAISAIKAANNTPKMLAYFSNLAKEVIARPGMREKFSKARIESWKNPTVRENHIKGFVLAHAAPGAFEKYSNGIGAAKRKPEARALVSKNSTEMWKRPAYRKLQNEIKAELAASEEFSATMKAASEKVWAREGYREKMRAVRNEQWKNPDTKRKHHEALVTMWARRKRFAVLKDYALNSALHAFEIKVVYT